MRKTWSLVLLALGVIGPNALAQATANACGLLTAKELTDAIGMPVAEGTPNETVIPSGPAKGQTMHGCMWRAGDQNMVSVSTIAAPTGEQRAAGLARIKQAYAQLKAKGWTETSESFGPSLKCSTMTPPASEANAPRMTGCMGEAKGQGIGVGFMGPGTTMPIAKIKALFDKASARIS